MSVALVTGAGRRVGIAAAIVRGLAADGWDVAFTTFSDYDERVYGAADADGTRDLIAEVAAFGRRAIALPVDLADPGETDAIVGRAAEALGPVSALILSHAESVDSDIRTTSVEAFDRHFAVNARASWQLVRAFALAYAGPFGAGRIVALTSDHTAGNLPYGASKGALDRIVLAAAAELRDLGVTANVVNPGPTQTGWIGEGLEQRLVEQTALGRLGTPVDAARLITFLCSDAGGWINGQLIGSNGGFPL